MDPERRLVESWMANASVWTDVVRSGGIESRTIATDDAVIDAVMSRRPRTVLDVGCGEGWLARRLTETGARVTGFDASERLVQDARETAVGSFHVLDYETFARNPLQLGSDFDVVVCNFSLLGETIGFLLRAVRDVLAADGTLIIQTVHPCQVVDGEPYADGWREERFDDMGRAFERSMPWYFRTVGSWLRELHEAGLSVRECREPIHPVKGRPLSLVWIAGR